MKCFNSHRSILVGTELVDLSLNEYETGRIKIVVQTDEYPDGLQLQINKKGKIRIFDESDYEIDIPRGKGFRVKRKSQTPL